MASYSELKQQAMAAEKAAIKAAIAETKTLDEAAKKIGVSRRTLQNRMRFHDMKRGKAGRRKKPLDYGRKGWTVEFAAVDLPDDAKLGEMPKDKASIVNALREHPTVAATAQALGVTRATLQKRMRSYGLPKGRSGRRKNLVGQKKEALSIKKTPEAARSQTLEAVAVSPALAVATEAVLGKKKTAAVKKKAAEVGEPTGLFAAKPAAVVKPAPESKWNRPEAAVAKEAKPPKAKAAAAELTPAQQAAKLERETREARKRQAEAELAAMSSQRDDKRRQEREAKEAAEAERKARELQELQEKAAREEAKRQEIKERKAKEDAERRARDVAEGLEAIRRVEEKEAKRKAAAEALLAARAAKKAQT